MQKAEKIVFLYACIWYSTRVVRQSHPGEITAPPRWNWSLTGVEYQMKVVVITDGNGCYTLSDRTGDSLRLQQIAKSMRLITTSSHLGTLIFVVILLSSPLPPVTFIVRTETASIFQFTDTIPQAYYSTDRFYRKHQTGICQPDAARFRRRE